jgi:hypothetical protein
MACGDISDDSFRPAIDHCADDADRGPLLHERGDSPKGALFLIAQEISVSGGLLRRRPYHARDNPNYFMRIFFDPGFRFGAGDDIYRFLPVPKGF